MIISEFVGLKSKMYFLIHADGKQINKAKGVNKNWVYSGINKNPVFSCVPNFC